VPDGNGADALTRAAWALLFTEYCVAFAEHDREEGRLRQIPLGLGPPRGPLLVACDVWADAMTLTDLPTVPGIFFDALAARRRTGAMAGPGKTEELCAAEGAIRR
jgi:hypothetical protein